MRFYKEVWGIIWEFNSIGDYVSFCIGRLLGIIIFFGGIYLLAKCDSFDTTTENTVDDYKVIPASFYQYDSN